MKTLHPKKSDGFQLPVFVLEEGGMFIAFSPALDLSTSGKTPTEAKKRFNEAMNLFFEELVESGFLNETLENLGWRWENERWQPPQLIEKEFEQISLPSTLAA